MVPASMLLYTLVPAPLLGLREELEPEEGVGGHRALRPGHRPAHPAPPQQVTQPRLWVDNSNKTSNKISQSQ